MTQKTIQGGGERVQFAVKAHLQYWEIPNDTHTFIAGGPGAGFKGVAISKERPNYTYFKALATLYLYENFFA